MINYHLLFSALLTIIIDDENDNNPKFRRPYYRRSITENSKNGVTIINVVADDSDKNRTITYSLEGDFLCKSIRNNFFCLKVLLLLSINFQTIYTHLYS